MLAALSSTLLPARPVMSLLGTMVLDGTLVLSGTIVLDGAALVNWSFAALVPALLALTENHKAVFMQQETCPSYWADLGTGALVSPNPCPLH